MRGARRFIWPVLCLLLGVALFVAGGSGAQDQSVRCGDRVMSPADQCEQTINGSTRTLSYDQMRDQHDSSSSWLRIAGGGMAGLSLLVLIVQVFAGKSGHGGVETRQRRQLAGSRAELARSRNWQLRETDPAVLAGAHVGVLAEGDDRKALNVVRGALGGWPFAIIDYVRTSTTFPKGLVGGITVWTVEVPAPLPPFVAAMKPSRHERRLYRPFRNGDPEFERRFRVKTDDPDAVRHVLTPQVTTILREKGIVELAGDGNRLVSHHLGFYSANKAEALLIEELEALVATAASVPAEVWNRLAARPLQR